MKRKLYLLLVLALLFVLLPAVYFYFSSPVRRNEINVLLGGDIYCGDRVLSDFATRGIKPFVRDFQEIADRADLHLANLEAPITTVEQPELEKIYQLRTTPEGIRWLLAELKVDGLSLANNHILDYGPRGLLSTMRVLNQANIKSAGAGANRSFAEQPVYFHRQGKKIAFLSFSNTFPRDFWADQDKMGTAFGAKNRVRKRVKESARRADYLIVSFHWGSELDTQPKKYQRRLAHQSINHGADVVFGHHPHKIQPVERYKEGIIFYSLGNYFFTTRTHEPQFGLLPEVTLASGKVEDVQLNLFNVDNYQVNYRPQLVHSFPSFPRLAAYLNRKETFRIGWQSDQKRWSDQLEGKQ